ncbi:hypothetical protein GCM10025734_36120 [Kitasatospora paranensis]
MADPVQLPLVPAATGAVGRSGAVCAPRTITAPDVSSVRTSYLVRGAAVERDARTAAVLRVRSVAFIVRPHGRYVRFPAAAVLLPVVTGAFSATRKILPARRHGGVRRLSQGCHSGRDRSPELCPTPPDA